MNALSRRIDLNEIEFGNSKSALCTPWVDEWKRNAKIAILDDLQAFFGIMLYDGNASVNSEYLTLRDYGKSVSMCSGEGTSIHSEWEMYINEMVDDILKVSERIESTLQKSEKNIEAKDEEFNITSTLDTLVEIGIYLIKRFSSSDQTFSMSQNRHTKKSMDKRELLFQVSNFSRELRRNTSQFGLSHMRSGRLILTRDRVMTYLDESLLCALVMGQPSKLPQFHNNSA